MKRFIEGTDRNQVMLLPESVEDYVGADNPVRIDVAHRAADAGLQDDCQFS
jgi:hypothetical protein